MDMEPSDEYLIQWKLHNTEMVTELHNLCMNEEFTDCTIAVQDGTFKAHKVVLSASSPYFRNIFAKTPCSHPVIFLKNVSGDHIKQLLKYMYVGHISVKREDLQPILETANGLQIRGIASNKSDTGSTSTDSRTPPPSSKEGRKGYVPKKLRQTPEEGQESPAQSRSDESSETPAEERNQPWNLSSGRPAESIGIAKFPIIGNYGRIDESRRNHRDNFIETMAQSDATGQETQNQQVPEEQPEESPQTSSSQQFNAVQMWMEKINSLHNGGNDNKEPGTSTDFAGLSGAELAERLRALAGPLTQTYGNWINNGMDQPTSTSVESPNKIAESVPAPPVKPILGEIGSNGKPSVTCEICGKKLADPSSLYRHRKIHSGEKPHKCPLCSRRFIQRYNMKQHMKTHRVDHAEMASALAAAAENGGGGGGETGRSVPRIAENI